VQQGGEGGERLVGSGGSGEGGQIEWAGEALAGDGFGGGEFAEPVGAVDASEAGLSDACITFPVAADPVKAILSTTARHDAWPVGP
jgi:hypothetical protein